MKYLQTFRLHPTPEQAAKIRKRFALAGYAYNWGLQETERVWDAEKRHLSYYDIKDIYHNHVHYELHRVCSREEDEALCHLDHAYSEYFEKRAQEPRHKEPEQMVSFTIRADNVDIDYDKQEVRIGYIGRVGCNFYRHVQGQPTTVTVKEVRTGCFNLVFLTEMQERQPAERTPEVVGIDLGLKTFATLSDGTKIDFPDRIWGRRATRHEAHLQRKLSRCKEGSKRWQRAKMKLGKFHEHRVNQRKDFHYQTAVTLTDKYRAIAVETLAIEDMMKPREGKGKWRSMNRNLSRYGLHQFIRRLEARCLRTGTQLLKVDRWEPTSKTCHVCGYVRHTLDLKIREWTCPKCHTHHDRDVNAAINIKTLGQRIQQTLPDVGGEVLTVEQTERPCCEPVKADGKSAPAPKPQKPTRPARLPQERNEHNISRLAVKQASQRTLSVAEFLRILQPVVSPQKLSQITDVAQPQLNAVRAGGWVLDWRQKMMAERCEALRVELLDVLRSKIPDLYAVSPKEYALQFNSNLKGWLRFACIKQEDPNLVFPANKSNCIFWHIYVNRLIRNLETIKVEI